MNSPLLVFSVATLAVALCFAGFLVAARRTEPFSTHRRVYGWLGAALALFWAEVMLVIAYLMGMVQL